MSFTEKNIMSMIARLDSLYLQNEYTEMTDIEARFYKLGQLIVSRNWNFKKED